MCLYETEKTQRAYSFPHNRIVSGQKNEKANEFGRLPFGKNTEYHAQTLILVNLILVNLVGFLVITWHQ